MTKQPVKMLKQFKTFIDSYGGIRKAAREFDIDHGYISLMYNGHKPISEVFAARIGWKLRSGWVVG
jgi:hypothetical protein